jgi:hypothetical protein
MGNYDAVFDPYLQSFLEMFYNINHRCNVQIASMIIYNELTNVPVLQWHYHCQNTPSRISSAAAQVITIAPNFVL